jgi:hypothetical protein
MKKKYLDMLAGVDGVQSYEVGETTPLPIIAAAIFFASKEFQINRELYKEIEEPESVFNQVFDNLLESGYLVEDNGIYKIHIRKNNEDDIKKEFNLFCLAGWGYVKKL